MTEAEKEAAHRRFTDRLASKMARDTDAPVPDALLVTQIDRDDDRTKEKVEAGVKEKKVEAEGIISEVAATEAAHRQFTDRLASKMAREDSCKSSSSASSRGGNMYHHIRGEGIGHVPEMSNIEAEENPTGQTPRGTQDLSSSGEDSSTTAATADGPRSKRDADDLDDLEVAESSGPTEDGNLQETLTSNEHTEDSGVRRVSSIGPRVSGRRRSTVQQWLRRTLRRVSSSLDANSTHRTNEAYDWSNPIQATLVHEASVSPAEPVEVYEAKEVSFFERRGGVIFGMLCVVSVTIALAVSLTRSNETTLD